MAKKSFNIEIKSNFSFKKINTNFQEMLDSLNLPISTVIASNSKKRIEKGVKPPLKESTLRQRREGKTSFSGHSVKPTPGETRPLLYSQRLFNSLKGTKDGLEIMDYGLLHQKGFIEDFGKVPARKFLGELSDDKNALSRLESIIAKKMTKAMRK